MKKEPAAKKEPDAYGAYFMNRTAADIMEEYAEQHDEWETLAVPGPPADSQKKKSSAAPETGEADK